MYSTVTVICFCHPELPSGLNDTNVGAVLSKLYAPDVLVFDTFPALSIAYALK